jgi:putative (di)nucleoside polyphosphate hydrolase
VAGSGVFWNNGHVIRVAALDRIDAQGYRANVGIIVSDGDGAVLLGGRIGQAGWQFPQGGIRLGESPEDAMFRELQEEIGLTRDDVEMLGTTRRWLRYRLPGRYIRRDTTPVCIGQKQRWFLLRLRGPQQALRLDTTATPEFDRWRWVDYWQPVAEVIFFKRRVYVQALHELAPLLFPSGAPPPPEWPAEWRLRSPAGTPL